jgi:hypothetical protein
VTEDPVLCPSSRCEEGATLLGVVLPTGRVAFASTRLEVTEEFVQIARAGRAPEKRFRFASVCAKSGCRQWTGSRCGVIDSIMADRANRIDGDAATDDAALPACSIRAQCRWFRQSGRAACATCPEVITDMRVASAFAPQA